MEPLSESRRAWLTRGAGVASLAPWDAYNEGSIGETIVDPEAQAMLEAVVEEPLIDDSNHDARRFGTAYETLDPITAKQIEREQINAMTGPVTRVHLGTNPDNGKLTINPDRKLFGDEFMRLARSVKRTLASTFGPVATLDDLHARVDLIADALHDTGVTIDAGTPDWREERARLNEPLDAEWHSAFETVQPVVAYAEGDIDPDFSCPRRNCGFVRPEAHEHIRITREHHRRPQNVGSQDEFWHTRLFDITAFELGTEGLVDPLVVQI